jgi:hypothetical protein
MCKWDVEKKMDNVKGGWEAVKRRDANLQQSTSTCWVEIHGIQPCP